MAKNHEISVYFSTNAIFTICHTPHFQETNAIPLGLEKGEEVEFWKHGGLMVSALASGQSSLSSRGFILWF